MKIDLQLENHIHIYSNHELKNDLGKKSRKTMLRPAFILLIKKLWINNYK